MDENTNLESMEAALALPQNQAGGRVVARSAVRAEWNWKSMPVTYI